ncbi:MAG: hypothetical protein WCT14_14895, partial [Treponemataceae bacterium]
MNGFLKYCAVVTTLAVLALIAGACSPQLVFQGVVGVDAVPPTYVSARTPTVSSLSVVFSEAVKVQSLRFDPDIPVTATSDGASEVLIDFSKTLEPGRRYMMDLTAEDSEGNTVTVLAPFIGRNDHPPRLVVNEIRTEYSKPKVEYVELFVKEAGQLGGLALVTTAAGFSEPVLIFPPLEVRADDYVVIHLRSIEEGLIDETGALDASTGTDSSPTARDFWVSGAEKRIHKTDVVALLDTDGNPLDGVAFTETPGTDWKSEDLRKA